MNRNEIKDIVYQCLYDQYWGDDIVTQLKLKHDDGEDELIYNELQFDSLDMIEFVMNLESKFGNKFVFDDNFINKEITLRKVIDYIDNKINNKDE